MGDSVLETYVPGCVYMELIMSLQLSTVEEYSLAARLSPCECCSEPGEEGLVARWCGLLSVLVSRNYIMIVNQRNCKMEGG